MFQITFPVLGSPQWESVKARKVVRQTVKHLQPQPAITAIPSILPLSTSTTLRPSKPSVNLTIPATTPHKEAITSTRAPPSTSQHGVSPHSIRADVSIPTSTDTETAALSVAGPSPIPASYPLPAKNAKAPQIVSSLFTSNPSSSRPRTSATRSRVGAPSNAPLTGDTSTFEGLGLDPLLLRHLKGKMKMDRPTGIQRSALPYMLSSPLDIDRKPDSDEQVETLRDIFIQSQTGSGKTLAYLLPIVQTLLPLSRLSYIDRSIGTLAIILAPTRELAQQISKVLEQILSMSLSSGEDEHMTRWLVSGLLTGGSTKTHEKARLRKGVPILVSTPGRLLDHLQNTASFKCAKMLFLVLDEADRLMDLGFEETIIGIIKALDGRRRIEIAAEKQMEEEGGGTMRWPFWVRGRRTVLCSATVDTKVERLSGVALRDPRVFRDTDEAVKANVTNKGTEVEMALQEANAVDISMMSAAKFTPPSQLAQKYIITPTKLRLVTLVALLRSLVAVGEGTKVIVFLSSTDSVDFHWKLLGGVRMGEQASAVNQAEVETSGAESTHEGNGGDGVHVPHSKVKAEIKQPVPEDLVSLTSPLFPATTVHRLHGSLPLRTRLSSLAAFSTPSSNPSILLATSVASRGLDLPLVRAVVQYDLPTEGGANEYVHRVGRTARAGRGGEAWAFVTPSEVDWVGWVEGKMGKVEEKGVRLSQVGVEDVLKKGFGGRGYEYEARATDVQLAFERWVLAADQVSSRLCLSFERAQKLKRRRMLFSLGKLSVRSSAPTRLIRSKKKSSSIRNPYISDI